MANSAAAAAGGGGGAPAAESMGSNPFWEVTNLFSQKNKQGAVQNFTPGASLVAGGGAVNPGNFLRMLRLLVRSNGGAGSGVLAADGPPVIFKQLGLENTDGAEILYNVISGFAFAQASRFFRPWLQDFTASYDYATGNNPSFTLRLHPEVRQQLGVLENTDTRSQYNWSQQLNTNTAIWSTQPSTLPTITITPYVDMWAQPDAEDLEKVPNQRIPAGVNLQTKLRHQTFTLNGANSSNSFLSTLTGNAVRAMLLIVRDQNGVRQDFLTDPIQWQLDNRNLGVLSPDIVFQWAEDFYRPYGGVARPTGVYPLPRFYSPGSMYGQGWLYTSNATALSWDSSTSGSATGNGTVELLQEEVYATGAVDPSLIDL